MAKKILFGVLGVIVLVLLSTGAFGWSQIRAFDDSMAKVYDYPLPQVERSTDPAVIERGKHLARATGACIACHGENLAGGRVEDFGPLGTITHGNITPGKNSLITEYSDAEIARLIRYGVKRDGTSARLMPAFEWTWWPDADLVAIVSYLRTLPPIDSGPLVVELSAMAKVLDRMDSIPLDTARRVDPNVKPLATPPAPTAEYGKLLAISCAGCHGEEHMSGGRIPGTPPEIPEPLNLTPHETGLKGWTYEDFKHVIGTGTRKNGQKLNEFMPFMSLRNMNETESRALWAYLSSLPPVEFGKR